MYARVLVEAVTETSPADLERRVLPKVGVLRSMLSSQGTAALVIAPWLSPRTREVLVKWGCGYLDLTGNVDFRLTRPGVVLRTQGADRDPAPAVKAQRSIRGAAAGALVRLLVDVRPPYRLKELAVASGLSLAYVSRLIDTLDRQRLLRRDRKHGVVDVDWQGLLRERAAEGGALLKNPSFQFIAPNGVDDILGRLPEARTHQNFAVTGSHAAETVAPLAVGGELVFQQTADLGEPARYRHELAHELGLLRVTNPARSKGANVRVVESPSYVLDRARVMDGVRYVGLSQVVLDCLSGPGRLPAAGEAVLEYMAGDEDSWRSPMLELP
jgi:hypothetical protein